MTRLWATMFFVLALFFGCTQHAAAQDREPRVGVMGQLAYASLNWSPDLETYRVRPWGGGVTFELPLGDNVAIETRGLITQRGGNTIIPGTPVTARITIRSLTVPVLLKLGARTGPYVVAGPEFGYRLKTRFRLDNVNAEISGDIDDLNPRFDYGLAVGAGFSTRHAFVEAMYSFGQRESDLLTGDIPRFKGDYTFKPKALTIGAGFRF